MVYASEALGTEAMILSKLVSLMRVGIWPFSPAYMLTHEHPPKPRRFADNQHMERSCRPEPLCFAGSLWLGLQVIIRPRVFRLGVVEGWYIQFMLWLFALRHALLWTGIASRESWQQPVAKTL